MSHMKDARPLLVKGLAEPVNRSESILITIGPSDACADPEKFRQGI